MASKNSPQLIIENLYLLPALKPSCHSYLIMGEKNTLVDPGAREAGQHLASMLHQLNLKMDDIDDVIYTHCHYDHTGAGEFFPHSKVYAHSLCRSKLLYQEEQTIHALKYQVDLPTRIPDIELNQGDIYQHGDWSWEILHTPGHSDDGICLLEKNKKILISGDTVFALGVPALITDSGSDASLIYSIEKLMQYQFDIILPGHGRIDTDTSLCLQKTKKNIINRIQKVNKQILEEATRCSSKKYS